MVEKQTYSWRSYTLTFSPLTLSFFLIPLPDPLQIWVDLQTLGLPPICPGGLMILQQATFHKRLLLNSASGDFLETGWWWNSASKWPPDSPQGLFWEVIPSPCLPQPPPTHTPKPPHLPAPTEGNHKTRRWASLLRAGQWWRVEVNKVPAGHTQGGTRKGFRTSKLWCHKSSHVAIESSAQESVSKGALNSRFPETDRSPAFLYRF